MSNKTLAEALLMTSVISFLSLPTAFSLVVRGASGAGSGIGGEGSYLRAYGTYVGRLRAYSNGISGQVYVVDEHHLFIRQFRFEKSGPETYFWVGTDAQPSPRGQMVPYPPLVQEDIRKFDWINGKGSGGSSRNIVTDKNEAPPELQKMHNVDVLLPLPNGLKVPQIKYLAIWCPRFTVNYGEVYIPDDIIVPKPMTLDTFPIKPPHLSSGRVTILDSKSFYIPNFYLRVLESGYHFWAGKADNSRPNKEGQMVANEDARFDDLKVYNGKDVIITLPGATTVFDINYLAVYSDTVQDNLGHVRFNVSSARIPPALGQTKKPGWWFEMPMKPPPPAKGKNSDENFGGDYKNSDEFVTFNRQLELPNCRELLGRRIRLMWLNQGQHIYFRVKVHMAQEQFAAVGIAATGSPIIEADVVKIFYNDSAGRYVAEDAFLSKAQLCDFPDGLCEDRMMGGTSGNHIRYMGSLKSHGLSVIDFRRLFPPGDMHDAPIAMDGPTQIIVAIGSMASKKTSANSLYFGPSNRNGPNLELENTTINFGSQEDTNSPATETPCLAVAALVPGQDTNSPAMDTLVATGATLGSVQLTENMDRKDTNEADWVIATMGKSRTKWWRNVTSYENSCPDASNQRQFVEPDPEEAWQKGAIRRRELLNARLGPPGGSKGYGAITGNPPMDGSVVWWINDLLMPVIYVERGKTYYFRVQGGDKPERSESYHPFYITDHPEGGYGKKNNLERKLETIYAGVEGGSETPVGIGPLCEFVTTDGADKATESESFEVFPMLHIVTRDTSVMPTAGRNTQSYRDSLRLACEPGRAGEYGWVNWTVAPDTKDIVYYQSFNGFSMGWKIRVVNEGDAMNRAAARLLPGQEETLLLLFALLLSLRENLTTTHQLRACSFRHY